MIIFPEEFDDIRPYYNHEIPSAMKRIAEDPLLGTVMHYLGKEDRIGVIKETLYSIKSTEEFQGKIMHPLFHAVITKTIRSFSYDGLENISAEKSYLFISNHRDIVFDAMLLEYVLFNNALPTSQITFGSNLMHPQFVVDIGLSNKMFKAVRKSFDMKTYLKASNHLYSYINYVVKHGVSVWIAQRNGRTKDGYDKTEPGLIRMLAHTANNENIIDSLHITPISLSYQWEPCDILKAVELYKSAGGGQYVKSPGEDLNSIITGIVSDKGDTHLSIRGQLDGTRYNDRLKKEDSIAIASDLDKAIHSGYRLWDTNFAAYDILNDDCRFSDRYTPALKDEFLSRMMHAIEKFPELNKDALKNIYLNIYAGPVYNCILKTGLA